MIKCYRVIIFEDQSCILIVHVSKNVKWSTVYEEKV